ncbi:MAG: sigma-54-dependent transcriptional regulator [Candidatus Binatia bacterium]
MNDKNPFVFVVDDDSSIRESLKNLIRSAGLNTETFASAQEFLASPRPDSPSCLVLDVQLPGLSGLDLQQELAKVDVQIPIVFITGHGDIPMSVRAMKAGAIEFLTKPFRDEDLLNAVEQAIKRSYHFAQLNSTPADEKPYSKDRLCNEISFSEIVGQSTALRRVLKEVETVAGTDSTVLIYGETGTGKELIARAIHNLSPRRSKPFVKLNCAAIPLGLLESELFGHEKGAFTGAVAQKSGRFELAHEGTLFLDEIGDIPLELQPKLLRVLQEQEFERLGSTRTTHVNVRIVAATNRDLAQMTKAKLFREDLYFRLNVFPIHLPPLRERSGDIPLLVRHNVDKYSQRMNKRVESIPPEAMAALCSYSWPGNIRELQNFIERSVILTPGEVLRLQANELQLDNPVVASTGGTLEDIERDHILRVLRETGGVIGGRHGAALRLGLKRTTLLSKMERMGISQDRKYISIVPDDIAKIAPPVKD